MFECVGISRDISRGEKVGVLSVLEFLERLLVEKKLVF